MPAVHRIEVDVRGEAPAGVDTIAADVVVPPLGVTGDVPVVLCCLPGGGSSRRYFDLDVPGHSMARHLAEAGFVVATFDHPGVGDSDQPDDGWMLTAEAVADVDTVAVNAVVEGLRAGTLVQGLASLDGLVPVGVGHSAGGLIAVHQQARHRPYEALALLGFAGGGLPGFLTDDERALAGDPERIRDEIAALAKARFGVPLPEPEPPGRGAGILVPDALDPAVYDALIAHRTTMLAVVGLTSMIPGSSAPALEAIDVPVFLGVGARDITGPSHEIPGQLPNCPDVTLFVLPDAGHMHNVAPNRTVLWDRLAAWARSIV